MATALDLLMSTKEDVNLLSEESDICTIDAKTRIIFVPSTIVVGGVQSDKNAERIKFSCPKIVGDNLDLSKFSVRINFENVSSVDFNVSIKDQYICDDVAVDGENVTFSWLIGRNAARYMGTVRFIVCAVKTDSDSNISVEWNTAIAEVPVLEGIEIDQPQIGQEEKDVINQLLELTKNTSAEAVQNVNSAKEQAIKDIQSVSQPDTTLTIEGGLAEAKATGEAIGSLKEDLSDLTDGVADVQHVTLPCTMSNEYVINPDGSVASSSSGHYVSNAVDISEYSVLKITARTNYTKLLYAFYDANSTFISGESSNAGESSTQITDKKVRVPNGAKYIRVSQLYGATPNASISGEVISVKGIEALSDIVDDITATETYPVEFLENITWTAGYINKSGTKSDGGTSYVYSTPISVKKGDIISVTNTISGLVNNMRFVTAYNAIGDAVFSSGAESVGSYTVPEGIISIVISITYSSSASTLYAVHHKTTMESVVLDAVNKADVLFNKKWCVCGDSFSFGGMEPMPVFSDGRYKGCRKVYPYFIGNRTHINIVDFTANGRTLAYPSDGSFSNSLTNQSSDYYYQNIPADVDFITIYLGINDSHHASGSSGSDGEDTTGVIPIGTIDDDTTATFGGAWNVVLSWLITNRPKAHIGIIVSNGVDSVAYRELTIAIAKKYGIAYIDLNGDERTPAMIRTVNPDIPQAVRTALINKWAVEVGANTHPNTDAHEYESFFIENFLRSI